MTTTAVADAGISQSPVTGNARTEFAASAGPPEGPGGFRVSATRQGATVKKPLPGGAASICCTKSPLLAANCVSELKTAMIV